MTCRPPPNTKPGTMCMVTRGRRLAVGEWDGQSYLFCRPNPDVPHGTLTDYHITRATGCRCGWVFSGVMPMPPRPQTAQEIARREIQRIEGGYYGISTAPDILVAFLAIADMPERP